MLFMLQPIILAAGKGTRMRTEAPKALFVVGGRTMLERILESFAQVPNCAPPLIVIGHKSEDVVRASGDSQRYVHQSSLDGTASAVKACVPEMKGGDHVCITYVDHPYLSGESLNRVAHLANEHPEALVLGTVQLPDFEGWRSIYEHFGRIIKNEDGTIDHIVEFKNADEEERAVRTVNPGVYAVSVDWLIPALSRIERNELTGELYLTDIVALAKKDGMRILSVDLPAKEALGINSPEDAELAESLHLETVKR